MHVNTERAELQLNGSARSAHQMNAALLLLSLYCVAQFITICHCIKRI